MSLDGGEWKLWRYWPGFSQRFAGMFGDDGVKITGTWEKSVDGTNWEYDLDWTYSDAERRVHPSAHVFVRALVRQVRQLHYARMKIERLLIKQCSARSHSRVAYARPLSSAQLRQPAGRPPRWLPSSDTLILPARRV